MNILDMTPQQIKLAVLRIYKDKYNPSIEEYNTAIEDTKCWLVDYYATSMDKVTLEDYADTLNKNVRWYIETKNYRN